MVRAGCRDQKTVRAENSERPLMKFPVASFCGGNILPAPREGGWVEDNQIEPFLLFSQRLEPCKDIAGFKSHRCNAINLRVPGSPFGFLFGTVDGQDGCRPPASRIECESAVVAETVKNPGIPAVSLGEEPVLTLIEEKTCLLPLQRVEGIPDAVFFEFHGPRLAPQHSLSFRKRFESPERRFVSFNDAPGVKKIVERVANGVLTLVHSVGDRLDDAAIRKAVNDQAGKEIALPVDEAVDIRSMVDPLAQRERARNPPPEKLQVDGFDLRGEKTNGDQGVGMIKTDAKRSPPSGLNLDDVTRSRTSFDLLDFITEDPGMPRGDPMIFLFPQNDPKIEMGMRHGFKVSHW